MRVAPDRGTVAMAQDSFKSKPTSVEIALYKVLGAISYEMKAEPLTASCVSAQLIMDADGALQRFVQNYPDWREPHKAEPDPLVEIDCNAA